MSIPGEKMRKSKKFSLKSFGGSEKSRTFASAIQGQPLSGTEERVLWKIYIRQIEVVQEAGAAPFSGCGAGYEQKNRQSL